ncbi:MAG: DUF5665 domain-containing protein [Lysobacterales bacterium]
MIPVFLGRQEACIKQSREPGGAAQSIDIARVLSYSSLTIKSRGIKMKSIPKSSPDKELVKVFEAAGVVDFLEYLQSGKRIMWINFRAGVAKGIGVTVGMTFILGILIWVLTVLVDLPLVGEYFSDAKQYVTEYAENTNYKEDFSLMNQQLQEINENLDNESEPEPPPVD